MNTSMKRLAIVVGMILVAVPSFAQKSGKNGTTLAGSKTVDICSVSDTLWRYSGDVSVWNEGALDTSGLMVNDCIQTKGANGKFADVPSLCASNLNGGVQIPAGTTLQTATTFQYEVYGPPIFGYIRNSATIKILNHSGSIGKATGPEPKATFVGDVAPCSTPCGCARSHGYWKTHPEAWPAGHSPSDPFYLSGVTWGDVLDYAGPNGYYILGRQYAAAILDGATGACVPDGVQDVLDLSSGFFIANTPAACPLNSSCGLQKTWAGTLDDYVTGQYPGGPAHCE